MSKSSLAIQLSKLKAFSAPKTYSEQYSTDSEIAADILWLAYMKGDIKNKVVADLGCGTGMLGIGCLLLGAGKVYFVDNDKEALATAAANTSSLGLKGYELINSDITEIRLKADVVVQNPPFGTKRKHADREFLLKAFETANKIYSIHKAASIDFVQKISKEHEFRITNIIRYDMPIKHQHAFHKKRIHRIQTACFRLEKS